MKNVLIPLLPEYTIQIPQEPWSLLAWFVWFALIIFVTIKLHDRETVYDRQKLFWLALLSVLILALTPFLGINPVLKALFQPAIPP